MNQPQAVIFDMDGVLIDAVDWHYQALNEALAIFDAQIGEQEHFERFNGLPTRVKLEMLTSEERLPGHLHEIISAVKQERTLRVAAHRCFPRVEHLLLFSWLRSRGCHLAVATNSIRATASAMLEFAGLLQLLDVLVTNEDVEEAKPAPDLYVEACQRLGVSTADALVIEDHPFGVQAAERAGCSVIQVSGVHEVTVSLVENVFLEWSTPRA